MYCEEVSSVINRKGYGPQWINYETDTLFLPHTSIFNLDTPLRLSGGEKVRSLMIAGHRYTLDFFFDNAATDRTTLCDTWQIDYEAIIAEFPNIKELYVCTNW